MVIPYTILLNAGIYRIDFSMNLILEIFLPKIISFSLYR